jgi:hypothetical protein
LCDEARVDVAISAVNDPPVARDDEAQTDEDSFVVVEVLENDTDAEGDIVPASVTVTSSPRTARRPPTWPGR